MFIISCEFTYVSREGYVRTQPTLHMNDMLVVTAPEIFFKVVIEKFKTRLKNVNFTRSNKIRT